MSERGGDATGVGDPGEASGEGSIRLVGTAHVSEHSVREVEAAIEEECPDVVAVELDEQRFRQMQGETPDDIDPSELLRGSVALQFIAYWILSYVQARMGERFGIEPGADMKAGIEAAGRVGAGVALVDRDIQVTVQRFWSRLSVLEKLKMFFQLALASVGLGADEDVEEFDPEELTDTDVVSAMMEEFRQFSPGGAEALIDERDAYIAHNLVDLREQGYRVVAVVGAGHREGIERYLQAPETLPTMESITGRDEGGIPWFKALFALFGIGFLVFFVLLGLAALSPAENNPITGAAVVRVLVAWFLFNGFFAFTLAKLAGARWLSAAVGGAVAWLTSLNPLLAPGWFAGYVELRYQPVNVSDIGRLNELLGDETMPVKEMYKRMLEVPLFRLIAVVGLTNVGSFVATVAFPFVVLPLLGGPFSDVSQLVEAMRAGIAYGFEIVVNAV
jgi:pheromone shutdown-related protein TraB